MRKYSKILYLDKIDSIDDVLKMVLELKKHNLEVYENEIAQYKKWSEKRIKELFKNISEDKKQEIIKEQEASLKEALERAKEFYDEYENFNILIDLSKLSIDEKTLNNVGQILKTLKSENINFGKVSFQLLNKDIDFRDRMPTILTQEELDLLKYFKQALVSKNLVDNIYLQEGIGGNPLTLKQVEKSNQFIEKIVQKIEAMNLSPFEAAVYIHDFCSSFYYNETEYNSTRTLADVVNSGSIVCVGYASMYKAIVDKLGMSGLSANLNVGSTNKSAGGHANNLIEIQDDKYNINGTYMEDSCWSAPGEFRSQNALTFCLYPIDDINNLELQYFYSNNIKMQAYYSLDTEFVKLDNTPKDDRIKGNQIKHKEFLDSIKNKGEPIDIRKYADAYFQILTRRGVIEEEAKRLTEEKINFSVALAVMKLKKCSKNTFCREVEKSFLEKYFSEEDIINKQIIELEKQIEMLEEKGDIDSFLERMELGDKISYLRGKKEDIRKEKEQKGLQSNKNIIEETLNL